jgi:hypothetical protein
VTVAADESEVDSYEIVLPPGWVQYPVRPGIADALYEHVRRVVEPSGNTRLLASLRTAIRKSTSELRQHGGIDVILPRHRDDDDTVIPASLTSARVELGDRGVDAALARLARGHEVETVEVPVGIAYKWHTSTVGTGDMAGLQTDNGHYLFPLPGARSSVGVIFTFGVIRADDLPDEYVEILWLIFDAMMQSLAWVFREDD